MRSVAVMRAQGSMGYVESEDYRAVRVEFSRGDVSALVVLPESGRTPADLLDGALDNDALVRLLFAPSVRGRVSLPRFRIDSDLDLRRYCEEHGALRPFRNSPLDGAEFGGITGNGAYVAALTQRARLECDEEGTVGEADLRAQLQALGGLDLEPVEFVDFVADRPFAFFVVHRSARCALFAAIVEEPEAP
ncbi:MAG: serpin family protein [bacterium]